MSAADITADGRPPAVHARPVACRLIRSGPLPGRDQAQHLPLRLADQDMERGGLRLAVQRRLDRAAGRLGLRGGDHMIGMHRPRHHPGLALAGPGRTRNPAARHTRRMPARHRAASSAWPTSWSRSRPGAAPPGHRAGNTLPRSCAQATPQPGGGTERPRYGRHHSGHDDGGRAPGRRTPPAQQPAGSPPGGDPDRRPGNPAEADSAAASTSTWQYRDLVPQHQDLQVFRASLRASSASHANVRDMVRYTRRKSASAEDRSPAQMLRTSSGTRQAPESAADQDRLGRPLEPGPRCRLARRISPW